MVSSVLLEACSGLSKNRVTRFSSKNLISIKIDDEIFLAMIKNLTKDDLRLSQLIKYQRTLQQLKPSTSRGKAPNASEHDVEKLLITCALRCSLLH